MPLSAVVALSAGNNQDLVAAPAADERISFLGFAGTFSVSIELKSGTTAFTGVVTGSSSNPQLSPFPVGNGEYKLCAAGAALKASVGATGVMRGMVFYDIVKVPAT